jgi:predicted O-methyltransferase YrrM
MAARWAVAGRLAIQDPRLLTDYVRWFLSERSGRPREGVERRIVAAAISASEARRLLANLCGAWVGGTALTRVRARTAPATEVSAEAARAAARLAGDSSLGELAYGIVRALRPDVVVETGVATGVTSAYVLAGLADNEAGQLHSIDLPPTSLVTAGLVAAAVPTELRDRWVYHWGSARRLLPPILRSHGDQMKLFIHDSDHRYPNMLWELQRAWEGLGPNGWLIADDVHLHTAFDDFAAAVGAQPLYVLQAAKAGCTGLLSKATRQFRSACTGGRSWQG